VHPQEPVLTLARCQALGRGGAAPPASGTRDTVCTLCTAGCKESTRTTRTPGVRRSSVTPAHKHVGGGGHAPSPDDRTRSRSQAWRRLLCSLSPTSHLSSAPAAAAQSVLTPAEQQLEGSVPHHPHPPWQFLAYGDTSCPPLASAQHPPEPGRSVPTRGRTHSHRFDAGRAVNYVQGQAQLAQHTQDLHPGHRRNCIQIGARFVPQLSAAVL